MRKTKMEKITVELCMGTTCFVMGSSSLPEFSESLSESIREKIELKHSPCMGLCKDQKYGKAPYVKVNGEVISAATPHAVAVRIRQIAEEQDD